MRFIVFTLFFASIISCDSRLSPEVTKAIEKAQQKIFFDLQQGSQVGKLSIEKVEKEVELLNDTLLLIDYSFKLGVEGYPTPLDYFDISLLRIGQGKFKRVNLLGSDELESFELYGPKIHDYYRSIISGEVLKNAKALNDLDNFELSSFELDSNRYLKVFVKGLVDDISFDEYGLLNRYSSFYIRTVDEPNKLIHCDINPLFTNTDSLIMDIHKNKQLSIVGLIDEHTNDGFGITRLTNCIIARLN
jgi:hypothetical protein